MIMEDERKKLIKFGRKMLNSGLTAGTGGNLSIFDHHEDLLAITPSGIPYEKMQTGDTVITDINGNTIAGTAKPSSELSLHIEIYRNRRDINAVIHTHSPFAVTVSCLEEEIPPVHYLVADAGGEIVPCAGYARFGSRDLAKKVSETLGDKYQAALMAHHGLIACGQDIEGAYSTAENIEFVAEIYWRICAVGEPKTLDSERMQDVISAFSDYGQREDFD